MISSGGIVLEAHDETDLLCGPSAEQGIVVIAPISEEEFRVVKINNAISETSRAVCHLVHGALGRSASTEIATEAAIQTCTRAEE
jgi:hypothetical protein